MQSLLAFHLNFHLRTKFDTTTSKKEKYVYFIIFKNIMDKLVDGWHHMYVLKQLVTKFDGCKVGFLLNKDWVLIFI